MFRFGCNAPADCVNRMELNEALTRQLEYDEAQVLHLDSHWDSKTLLFLVAMISSFVRSTTQNELTDCLLQFSNREGVFLHRIVLLFFRRNGSSFIVGSLGGTSFPFQVRSTSPAIVWMKLEK